MVESSLKFFGTVLSLSGTMAIGKSVMMMKYQAEEAAIVGASGLFVLVMAVACFWAIEVLVYLSDIADMMEAKDAPQRTPKALPRKQRSVRT